MQKLLNEWRAYIREAKKPTTYRAGTIQCPAGATGVVGYVKTPKGRKLVKFCPSESEAKADAGMKLHKKGIEQALLKIKNSKEALDYLKNTLRNNSYEVFFSDNTLRNIDNALENIISAFDPFDPDDDFKMDVITKENYNKRFDSIMEYDEIYSLFDPFKNIEPKLEKELLKDKNTNMQKKLADLYNNALKLFNHVKEYHKARIAY